MARKNWYLTEWREHRGMSQRELADAVTEATQSWGDRAVRLDGGDVSKLEKGKQRFNQHQLEAFAQVLHCDSPADLFYSPEEVSEIRRIVEALVKRGRSGDIRVLRALLQDDKNGSEVA